MPTFNGDLPVLTEHPDYYIDGADLFFLAERIQFKVHRYFFARESPYFRSQLEIPASAGGVPKGSNGSNAIVLSGVKSIEFELFLWVFYNPTYSLYNKTVEEWEVILRLADRWTFAEVKDLAVRELEKLTFPEVDRIAIYQANNVDRNLLVPPYARLCEREESLKLSEGLRLGMETTLLVAQAREEARRNPELSVDAIIRKVFDIPADDNHASQAPAGKAKEGNTNEGNQINGVNGEDRGEGQSGQNKSIRKTFDNKPTTQGRWRPGSLVTK